MKANLFKIVLPAVLAVGFATTTQLHASFIPLGTTNYFQNFDTLNSSGKSKTLPPGWAIMSQDGLIYADDGSSKQANIYSYGLNGSQNRALGALTSGGNDPIFGAAFQNTGQGAIHSLNVSFTGEEWRLGQAGVQNTLDFQYSLNAGGLNSGTWINVPSLSFSTPNTVGVGAHNGTLAANQVNVAGVISFLNIPVGSTFWIRWNEPPAGSPGDGLAIDNFSMSAVPEVSTVLGALFAAALCGLALRRQSRSSNAVSLA